MVDEDGRSFGAEAIETLDEWLRHRELWCESCGAPAKAYPAYTKTNGVEVAARFSLMPGRRHTETCGYVSEPLEEEAEPLPEPDDCGLWHLLPPLSGPVEVLPPGDGQAHLAAVLTPSAASILRDAADYIDLWERFTVDPDSADELEVIFEDLTLGWGQLCWPVRGLGNTRAFIAEQRRPEGVRYPIAVWGLARVGSHGRELTLTPRNLLVENETGFHPWPKVRVRALLPDTFRYVRAGDKTMAVGYWTSVEGGTAVELRAGHWSAVRSWPHTGDPHDLDEP